MPAKEIQTRLRFVIGAALFLFALAGVASLADEDPDLQKSGYAGADACAECHPDVFDSWKTTAHSKTLRVARADDLPREMAREGAVRHPPGRTRFKRDGDKIIAETMGPGGSIESYEVSHVVGVRRILMFLTETTNGRLQVLPAMLDVPGDEWFDYSHLIFGAPGDDPAISPRIPPGSPTFWTGMTRYFDARCARCHTSGWSFEGPAAGGPNSSFRAMGIDCETCHGPSADHAAWWSDHPPAGLTADPILKIGELPRDRAVSVCLRCHMEGEVVDHDFEPGDDFFDHFDPTLLNDRERVDASGRALELIYDGLPFSTSRCGARGRLTCASCHAPHGSPYRSQLRSHGRGNELCAKCHEPVVKNLESHSRHNPSGAGSGCTGCHMPFRSIERGHGAITDHTIGIPDPGPRGACVSCHTGQRGAPGGVPRLDAELVAAAYRNWWPKQRGTPAWAQAIEAGRERRAGAEVALAALAQDPTLPRVVRASAVLLLAGYPEQALQAVVRLVGDEDDLVARNAAGALGAMFGDLPDAVLHNALLADHPAIRHRAAVAALKGWDRVRANPTLLEALIPVLEERTEAVPEDDLAWFRLGAALQLSGNVSGAIRAYRRQLELDPYAHAVRRAVGELEKQGR